MEPHRRQAIIAILDANLKRVMIPPPIKTLPGTEQVDTTAAVEWLQIFTLLTKSVNARNYTCHFRPAQQTRQDALWPPVGRVIIDAFFTVGERDWASCNCLDRHAPAGSQRSGNPANDRSQDCRKIRRRSRPWNSPTRRGATLRLRTCKTSSPRKIRFDRDLIEPFSPPMSDVSSGVINIGGD